jgi:hypothetical protein
MSVSGRRSHSAAVSRQFLRGSRDVFLSSIDKSVGTQNLRYSNVLKGTAPASVDREKRAFMRGSDLASSRAFP